MTSHRLLSAATAALALLAAAGCSTAGTAPLAPSGAQPAPFARSLGRPVPNAVKNFVYVADAYSNTVWIFPAGGLEPPPVGSVTNGVSGPEGVAIDAGGKLYVANTASATVTIYPPGSSSPSLTLSQGLINPAAVAVDSKGNVFVSNELGGNTGSVVEFPPGQTTPSEVIGGLTPYGVAVDSAGTLYVGNSDNSAAYVSVYPPGATKPSKRFGGHNLTEPLGVMVGPTGAYVCDYFDNGLYIYAPKSYTLRKKQTVQIVGTASLTLSHNSGLYIGEGSTNVVAELSERLRRRRRPRGDTGAVVETRRRIGQLVFEAFIR